MGKRGLENLLKSNKTLALVHSIWYDLYSCSLYAKSRVNSMCSVVICIARTTPMAITKREVFVGTIQTDDT